MKLFEFVIYDDGVREIRRECAQMCGENAARAKAGRLAKADGGPVDLAYAGEESWNERYITTASPSQYHTSGYRFERLA